MAPDTQSMISVALPTIGVLVGTLVNNSRLSDFRSSNDRRFDDTNRRFDEMRDLIRLTSERHDANLRRVEEVLDARLKHLEERER